MRTYRGIQTRHAWLVVMFFLVASCSGPSGMSPESDTLRPPEIQNPHTIIDAALKSSKASEFDPIDRFFQVDDKYICAAPTSGRDVRCKGELIYYTDIIKITLATMDLPFGITAPRVYIKTSSGKDRYMDFDEGKSAQSFVDAIRTIKAKEK